MSDDLRDRLDAMSTDHLLEILERRHSSEWREEVFPIVEELLHARGVEAPPTPEPEDADKRGAREMAHGTRRRYVVGDSVWCGGSACLLLGFVDAVALVKGGRAEVPASVLWAFVAGMLLPVLNVYFVARELIAGRRKDAALGVILSVVALIMALDPPWGQFVGVASHHGGWSKAGRGAGAIAARQCASAAVGGAQTDGRVGYDRGGGAAEQRDAPDEVRTVSKPRPSQVISVQRTQPRTADDRIPGPIEQLG